MVIEYFLLPDHACPTGSQNEKDCIAIWSVAPENNTPTVKIKLIQVPVDIQQLNADIHRLGALMAESLGGEEGSEKRSEVAGLLRRLNSKLIEPLEQQQLLPAAVEAKTLVTIIPHLNLLSVPFAALLDGTGTYLVEKYSLQHATALSVLKYTRGHMPNAEPAKPRRFLALVSPDPLPAPEAGDTEALPPLVKTAESFPHIASLYAPPVVREIYTGAEATGMILRARAAYADVLYFATHAEVKNDDP